MEMKLVPNKHDSDMVEMYHLTKKYLYGAIHVDTFIEDKEIYDKIFHKREEVIIKIEMQPF